MAILKYNLMDLEWTRWHQHAFIDAAQEVLRSIRLTEEECKRHNEWAVRRIKLLVNGRRSEAVKKEKARVEGITYGEYRKSRKGLKKGRKKNMEENQGTVERTDDQVEVIEVS